MTVEQEKQILHEIFDTVDHIDTLHLTGGGEPFLHPKLPELIEAAMDYAGQFGILMLFTNCTIPVSDRLMDTLTRYNQRILVQVSQYGLFPKREQDVLQSFLDNNIRCKLVKYYGENQDFGGWVDFGPWKIQGADEKKLEKRFHACAVTKSMCGNWRTRDGKVHWCSRSQRGVELGYLPDMPEDYVDLFDGSTREEKQRKFRKIEKSRFLSACNYCSGDQGTEENSLRHAAAEQMEESK